MANVTINDLGAFSGTLDDTDIFEIESGGVSAKLSVAQLKVIVDQRLAAILTTNGDVLTRTGSAVDRVTRAAIVEEVLTALLTTEDDLLSVDGAANLVRVPRATLVAEVAADPGLADAFAPAYVVPVVESGTTDTLDADDHGQIKRYTESSLVTVTIPTDTADDLDDGFSTVLVAEGAAGLTLDVTGITVTGGANTTIAQGETMVIVKTATADTWLVIGGTS